MQTSRECVCSVKGILYIVHTPKICVCSTDKWYMECGEVGLLAANLLEGLLTTLLYAKCKGKDYEI